jgi:cytidyltransferase-like protein
LNRSFGEQANNIIKIFDLKDKDSLLDFGCAYGGLLNALSRKGNYNLIGTDISTWAIEFGKQTFKDIILYHYNRDLLIWSFDYILFLDVLEHMNDVELKKIFHLLTTNKPKKILIRIPVSKKEGEDFVLECSKKDKTHIQCHDKNWWLRKFKAMGYNFEPVNEKSIYDSEGVLAGILKPQKNKEKVVAISGYFNPLHIGHIDYINSAKKLGDKLIVIVNNDLQVLKKKGKIIVPEMERLEILKNIKNVDDVVLSIDINEDVCDTLEMIKPDIFANGGDRTNDNIPEIEICNLYDIKMVFNVGGKKVQSSSNILKKMEGDSK